MSTQNLYPTKCPFSKKKKEKEREILRWSKTIYSAANYLKRMGGEKEEGKRKLSGTERIQ